MSPRNLCAFSDLEVANTVLNNARSDALAWIAPFGM